MTSRRDARGFLVMDTLAGIALAMFLLMVMTVAVTKQAQREKEFSEMRTAARSAEAAMLALESGAPIPAGAKIERLPGDAIAGYAWARVTVVSGKRVGTLVGLVQSRSLDANGGVR